MAKTQNPYNSLGKNYYEILISLKNSTANHTITNQNDFQKFLNVNHISSYNFTLNTSEENLLKTFFTTFTIDRGMAQLIDFEGNISTNYPSNQNLLRTLAVLKYGIFFTSYSSSANVNSAQEFAASSTPGACSRRNECIDRCLCTKAHNLSKSNWVDKAYFMIIAVESFAVWVVSCEWDCW